MGMDEDLTARARIRDAALRQFAEQGFAGTTIRGIAAEAGVSLGLVRHHFGSKEALRDAVDAHVLAEVRRLNDKIMEESARSTFSPVSISPFFLRYLSRALLDGSALVATMFDQFVELTAQWLDVADKQNVYPPHTDRRARAGVLTAMVLGIPLLREHLDRVLGVDTLTPEGSKQISLAQLDLYSHTLITPELADAARATLETDNGSSS
jgi:AcrR family transcriptional regulator